MQTNTNTSPAPASRPEPSSSRRRGKIARLPRDIRDHINTRLDDGQEADDILPWLNALPEVKVIIKKRFDGVPVSPQNLSAWRQGGFQEWLLLHQLLDTATHVHEHFEEMFEPLECDDPDDVPLAVADQLIAQISLRFNAFLANWSGGPLDAEMAMMLKLGQFILKLQQAAYRGRRQAIELVRFERQAEREYENEIRAELLRDKMTGKFVPRKAEEAHAKEKPKKPAPKPGSTQPVVQPAPQSTAAPAPGQSNPIKANQASQITPGHEGEASRG
jgi:hypothetical protein